MLALTSLLVASLALGSGSHASPDVAKWKRAGGGGGGGAASPITVTKIHPTQSFVSPEDAACTVTYTTVLPGVGTKPGGQATGGLEPHTYTVSYVCDCSPHAPCTLPSSPEICPPGLTVTTTVCEKCHGGPKTYTLTVPTTAPPHPTGKPGDQQQPGGEGPTPGGQGQGGKPAAPGQQGTGTAPGQGGHGQGESGGASPGSKAPPGQHTGGEGAGGHASAAPPGAAPGHDGNNNNDGNKAGETAKISGHGGNAGGGAKNGTTESAPGPSVVATAGSWVLAPPGVNKALVVVMAIFLGAIFTGIM